MRNYICKLDTNLPYIYILYKLRPPINSKTKTKYKYVHPDRKQCPDTNLANIALIYMPLSRGTYNKIESQ